MCVRRRLCAFSLGYIRLSIFLFAIFHIVFVEGVFSDHIELVGFLLMKICLLHFPAFVLQRLLSDSVENCSGDETNSWKPQHWCFGPMQPHMDESEYLQIENLSISCAHSHPDCETFFIHVNTLLYVYLQKVKKLVIYAKYVGACKQSSRPGNAIDALRATDWFRTKHFANRTRFDSSTLCHSSYRNKESIQFAHKSKLRTRNNILYLSLLSCHILIIISNFRIN